MADEATLLDEPESAAAPEDTGGLDAEQVKLLRVQEGRCLAREREMNVAKETAKAAKTDYDAAVNELRNLVHSLTNPVPAPLFDDDPAVSYLGWTDDEDDKGEWEAESLAGNDDDSPVLTWRVQASGDAGMYGVDKSSPELTGDEDGIVFATPAEAMRWCEERDEAMGTEPADETE